MKIGFDTVWPAYLATAFVLAAVVIHIKAYATTTRPVRPVVRRFLLSIRLVALGLILLALWRPAVERQETMERKGRMTLLVDVSRSMSIGDETLGEAGVSRLRRAEVVFAEQKDLWDDVVKGSQVTAYSFADEVDAIGVPPEQIAESGFDVAPTGDVTALGEALVEAARATPVPQAILVISDGLSNSGVDPLDTATDQGPPVYAISVGSDTAGASTKDIAVTGIFAPGESFSGHEVEVVGEFAATGLAGRTIEVSFSAGGEAVDTAEVAVSGDEDIVQARFKYTPEDTGSIRLEIAARPLSEEIVTVNNSAATYMDVTKGRVRVLHLEGSFRWETKFIRLALEAAKDVDYRLLVPRADTPRIVANALSDEWDVLIIGSIEAATVGRAALPAIEQAVSAGAGVLFLGGDKGLGRGGWQEGPAAPLLPLTVSSDEKLDSCLWAVEADAEAPFGSVVTWGNARWSAVSPILAANIVTGPAAGASVIMTGKPKKLDETTGSLIPCPLRTDTPLMAVQPYGKGRTAAFAGEGTWRWATGAGIVAQAEKDEAASMHRRFWRQVVFWLAHHEDRSEVSVSIELPRHRVELGDDLEILARVYDENLEELTDAEVEAVVTTDGFERSQSFWLEGDKYAVDYRPERAGDYGLTVTASRDGKVIAKAESAFIVTSTDAEFVTLVSRPRILAALARATGGKYAPADDARVVFSEIARTARSSSHTRLVRRELWSSWWYLALVVALLAIEWSMRKFAGLV